VSIEIVEDARRCWITTRCCCAQNSGTNSSWKEPGKTDGWRRLLVDSAWNLPAEHLICPLGCCSRRRSVPSGAELAYWQAFTTEAEVRRYLRV
jgi:hypothetical protein